MLEFQIQQQDGNFIDTLPLVDIDDHSYLSLHHFTHHSSRDSTPALTNLLCGFSVSTNQSWPALKCVVDNVHRHICGHSNFNDVKLLLQRNRLWSSECSSYLSKVMEQCKHCHLIDAPIGTRVVSLANISRNFN